MLFSCPQSQAFLLILKRNDKDEITGFTITSDDYAFINAILNHEDNYSYEVFNSYFDADQRLRSLLTLEEQFRFDIEPDKLAIIGRWYY